MNIIKEPNITIEACATALKSHHKKFLKLCSLPFNNLLYKLGNFNTLFLSTSLSNNILIIGRQVKNVLKPKVKNPLYNGTALK